jgi:hypothetical protein
MAIPTKQRVVLLREFGGPDRLAVVERPVPEPGTGEVLVKVLAASVQFTDIMLRKGQYPGLNPRRSLLPSTAMKEQRTTSAPSRAQTSGEGVGEASVGERAGQRRQLSGPTRTKG